MRLVKGSHIVVPRLYEGEHAYILQNDDRRVVFVIPYEGSFSLIGTTDIPYDGDPSTVTAAAAEIDYLCAAINRHFRVPLTRERVLWSYAGVRPLFDDGAQDPSQISRDHVLIHQGNWKEGTPVLVSVFGGKITTYRRLAETVLARLADVFPSLKPPWTARAVLPGGDLGPEGLEGWLKESHGR